MTSWSRLVQLYYLVGTPLFALLDGTLGLNVRVAFLDAWPTGRWLYYAIGTALGLVITRRPDLAGPVGLTESVINIGLLMVSVALWYGRALDLAGSELALGPEAPTTAELLNFVLAAAALVVSYVVRSARVAPGRR